MSGLTPQQEKFCQLVASGNTYADAYRESYKVSPKTKDESIWVSSSRMMADVKVQLRVKELQEGHRKRNEVTLDEVLKEMANWLRFDVKSIFNEDGSMKQLREMNNEESSSIASYECVELFGGSGENKVQIGYLKKVKLIDKRAVAEMFLKKFGAFITNVKLNVEDLSYLDELLKQIKK